jgi:hypothetical protein
VELRPAHMDLQANSRLHRKSSSSATINEAYFVKTSPDTTAVTDK